MLGYTVMVAMATCLIYSSVVQSQFVQDGGVCGVSKGCFNIPSDCDTADPANSCTAFSSWSLGEDGLILFNLIAGADAYIAIGLSKSGLMDNSEVYACTSNIEVVRSRNDGRSNNPLDLKGVSDQSVTFENGVLSCTFKREQNVTGDADFFNLQTGNEYTPLLAWGASLTSAGHVTRHTEREVGSGPTDFAGVGCGESKGCFSIPSGCDTTDPANSCTAFSSWSLGEDGLILFNLVAGADAYIAIGLSKSGLMDDSEVYACTSNREVVRSRNDGRNNNPLELKGVSDQSVTFANGVLSCTFKREQSVAGDADFFNLETGNEYTPLLAWGASLTTDGHVTRHTEREVGSGPTDFTENSAARVGSSVTALQKLHGIFMVLAWLGFAAIGITTARFFKKSLPGKLCGKPSWFAVHRFCMVSVVTLAVIAYIVIIIQVGGYIKPGEGTIRFTHAILGTIVMALGPINVIMALFRPHPGQPWRNLFNWCHWGVGMSALLLGVVTILLGSSNRPDQEGVLLESVPPFVFPIVVALVFFHLAVWVLLTVIDLLQKKAVNEIPMEDKAGPNATSASTTGLAEQEPPKEPIIKLILYGVYLTVVVVGVLVIVLAVGIGKKM